MFIISPEGLWTIKPNESLIEIYKKDVHPYPKYNKYNKEGDEYAEFKVESVKNFEALMNILQNNTNNLTGALARGFEIEKLIFQA